MIFGFEVNSEVHVHFFFRSLGFEGKILFQTCFTTWLLLIAISKYQERETGIGMGGRQNESGHHPCFLCFFFPLLFYSFPPHHFSPLLFVSKESHFSCFLSAFFSYLSCFFLHRWSAVSFLHQDSLLTCPWSVADSICDFS